jgi:hypothetical protein
VAEEVGALPWGEAVDKASEGLPECIHGSKRLKTSPGRSSSVIKMSSARLPRTTASPSRSRYLSAEYKRYGPQTLTDTEATLTFVSLVLDGDKQAIAATRDVHDVARAIYPVAQATVQTLGDHAAWAQAESALVIR